MKKFFVLGLVAVALSAGLMLASCSKCPGDGKCEYTTAAAIKFATGGNPWCSNITGGSVDKCFGKTVTYGDKCKC